jgi:hypothetical protein
MGESVFSMIELQEDIAIPESCSALYQLYADLAAGGNKSLINIFQRMKRYF